MRRRNRYTRTGSLDISQGTSVETRRQSVDSFASSVLWPVAQSVAIAISSVAAGVSVALCPVLMGDRVFWFVCGVTALGNTIYGIKYEIDWKDRLSWPLVSGMVAWCLYAFLNGVFKVPQSPWLALFSFASIIFTCTLSLWLWLSVGPKLLQQSLHQERYMWEAIASIIEWGIKKPKPRPGQPTVYSGRVVLPDNGREPEAYDAPLVEELTEIELFLMLADEYGTLARDDSNRAEGLRGKIMANGETLSKNAWRRSLDWLLSYKYIEEADGGGYRWLTGASAQLVLGLVNREIE